MVCGLRSPSEPSRSTSTRSPRAGVVVEDGRNTSRARAPPATRWPNARAGGEDVGLRRAELVRDTVTTGLHPLEVDAELLVEMAMERHRGAHFRADEVEDRLGAE